MSSANIAEPGQLLALAHEDLACYSIAQLPEFERAPHHEMIVSKLEAIERSELTRLMIFLPPRHGKTLITSSIFPAWYLGRHPERHVIFATYGQELSDDFGRRVRNFIVDQLHQSIFPTCRLSEDSTAAHRFNTTQGGAYYAVGRGGPITGRGPTYCLLMTLLRIEKKQTAKRFAKRSMNGLHQWHIRAFRLVARS